jgi:hypothetical protein
MSPGITPSGTVISKSSSSTSGAGSGGNSSDTAVRSGIGERGALRSLVVGGAVTGAEAATGSLDVSARALSFFPFFEKESALKNLVPVRGVGGAACSSLICFSGCSGAGSAAAGASAAAFGLRRMVVLKPESVRCTVLKPDSVRFNSTMTQRQCLMRSGGESFTEIGGYN